MTKTEAYAVIDDAIRNADMDTDGLSTLLHNDEQDALYTARVCAFMAHRYGEIAAACARIANTATQ